MSSSNTARQFLTSQQHPTFRPPRVVLHRAPYQVRRLGWGYFTLEAEVILKAPYTWITGNSGRRQRGLELTWTLDFTGDGRQGRVRAKVKKLEEEGSRRLRTRPAPAIAPIDDDDEEDDSDYEDDDDDEDRSEEEEEDVSEFVETPRR